MLPKAVSDVELAFPAHVIGTYLPAWDTIPDDFKQNNAWVRRASDAFAGCFDAKIMLRPGVDFVLASRHLRACLGSYEPKHEHKIAGVAYLMSLWFEIVEEPS